MKKYFILSAAMAAAIGQTSAAELKLKIKSDYLHLPVSHAVDRVRISLLPQGAEEIPVNIRLSDKPEYWVFKDVSALKGKKLTISYPDGLRGIELIRQADTIPDQSLIYHEANRPQFHFTTRRGWINDPNGLVYHNGEYHLYYQHNPFERDWENMHWGHAVSRDLVHWHELPTALHPDHMGTMFSGSAVIDHDNDSGFGSPGNPALVAAYTIAAPGRQMQGIAYSLDNGRTFTKYSANPVIDSKELWDSGDTRDPKLFKYADHWVMVLNERDGHSIYTSPNLRDWTYKSHTTGFWECPDLFELPVDGDPTRLLWVMYGASGTYMLGHFDGERFTPISGKHRYTAGTGYAAQTYSDIPAADGRRIQISWSRIGHPGMNFNGMMLLPTELTLRTTKDGPRLASKPVREVEQLCSAIGSWTDLTQQQANDILSGLGPKDRLRLRFTVELSHATDATLNLDGQRLVDYDMNGTTLNGWFYSPQDPTSMQLTADVYIDRTSVEVFVEDGLFSYSLPRHLRDDASHLLSFGGNRLTIKSLELFDIASIWE
ncbi:MAG: glycoside hydrolase family 32 protein [Muribaculaceae bacterium]|nr:glycoside hydrolase family 32 protein [Muribaculaceae bacterium]